MSDFVVYLLELMSAWGRVAARRMFGGYGLYRDGTLFAIVMDETLYLKADVSTQSQFIAAGSAPFVYQSQTRNIELTYWRAPDACLDDAEAMSQWCTLAWTAAHSAHRDAVRPTTRGKKPAPSRKPRTRRPQ